MSRFQPPRLGIENPLRHFIRLGMEAEASDLDGPGIGRIRAIRSGLNRFTGSWRQWSQRFVDFPADLPGVFSGRFEQSHREQLHGRNH